VAKGTFIGANVLFETFSFSGFRMKNPPPPKTSIDDAAMLPEMTAGWLSLATFEWITPLMTLGYSRPLEASDLYKLPHSRSSAYIADKILTSFDARRRKAEDYNERLSKGEIKTSWRAIWWTLRGNRSEREKRWREVDGKQKASLVYAMNDSIKWWVSSAFRRPSLGFQGLTLILPSFGRLVS
jgi:hypothetical protein